jgi:hypothetical protein
MDTKTSAILHKLDTEIYECRKRMYYLRVGKPENGALGKYDSLCEKLTGIKYMTMIQDIETLSDICILFFGDASTIEIIESANTRSINLKQPVLSEYKTCSKCEIDPYFKGPDRKSQADEIQTRRASISFKLGNRWKILCFDSSFDLVILLCRHFLPDGPERDALQHNLEKAYNGAVAAETSRRSQSREKEITENAQRKDTFIKTVGDLNEFKAFKEAVQTVIGDKELIKGFNKQDICNHLKELIELNFR